MYEVENYAEDPNVLPVKPKEGGEYVVAKFSKGDHTLLENAPKIYDLDRTQFLFDGRKIYYRKMG